MEEIALSAQYALSQATDEGICALGGQLAVLVEGDTVVNIAIGRAEGERDLVPDDLHNVYCLFKPMVYLLLGHALETNGCLPDEPLDGFVNMPPWAPQHLTYRQLAAHDAALGDPSAAAWKMTSPHLQEDLLKQSRNALGPAYSEISGGLIAEHILEQVTGTAPSKYCAQQLLEPLGLADQVIIDPELAISAHKRIRAPFTGCLLYTSPSPRDRTRSRMPSSA